LDGEAYLCATMPSTLIVLTGPPLPGRWSLARALERRLGARRFVAEVGSLALLDIVRALARGGGVVLVDGDLATREARAEVLELAAELDARAGERAERVLVEWRCSRKEAEREVFHRYASRPRTLGAAELERYVADARVREPIDDARFCSQRLGARAVVVGPELSLDEQLARIVAALRTPPPEPPAADDPSERRVMVVEDDPEERATLAEVLEELGYVVEQAPDAGVAMALLDAGVRVELLISDHLMPGTSGVELARFVAQHHSRVRTVLLTAFSDEGVCRGAIEANTVTVLAKPLRVIDLERALDEA
jgi:CheY-like chemotaxis protein/predicted kinase